MILAFTVSFAGCVAPPAVRGGDAVAVLVLGADPDDASLILTTGRGDTPTGSDGATASFIVELALPFRTLVPFTDAAGPPVTRLVRADTPGARPIPLVSLRAADGSLLPLDLSRLPGPPAATFLPPLSDNACAASGGCADEWTDPDGHTLRICARPCPTPPFPSEPTHAAPPQPPALARTRLGTTCGVRAAVDTAETTTADTTTTALVFERCVAATVRVDAAPCAAHERREFGGACVPLAACPRTGFADGLDEARTLFVATAETGDGSRDRPAGAIPTTLPPGVDTVAARGTFTLAALPDEALTVVSPCPSELTLVGSATRSAGLTLVGASVRGRLVIDDAPLTLRGVEWDLRRAPSGLVARAGATITVDGLKLIGASSIASGLSVDHATLRGQGLSTSGARLLTLVASTAELEDVLVEQGELRITGGATVALTRAELRAAPGAPLLTVRDAALVLRSARVTADRAPSGAIVADDATLTLADVTAVVTGPFAALTRGHASLEDVAVRASIVGPPRVTSAIQACGATLGLTRVDLTTTGPALAAVLLRDATVDARELILDFGDADAGARAYSTRSTWARVASFGAGRNALHLLGGAHSLTDTYVSLAPPRTPLVGNPSTAPIRFSAEDPAGVKRVEFTSSRVLISGGDYGLDGSGARGVVTLRDLDVGPSTREAGMAQDRFAALRVDVEALDAARVRVRARAGRGVLIRPDSETRRLGPVALTDLWLSDIRAPAWLTALCPSDVRPALAAGPVTGTAEVARVVLSAVDSRGAILEVADGASLSLSDLTASQVRCRVLDARGPGSVGVERVRVRRDRFVRDMLSLDDVLNAAEGVDLTAVDVDVDVATTRSFLRINDTSQANVTRWRAEGLLAALVFEAELSVGEGAARLVDGVAVEPTEVTILGPIPCADVARRPPYLRVLWPSDRPVLPGCP